MKNDKTVLPFRESGSIANPLTKLAREGARRMLTVALKAEADGSVARFADEPYSQWHPWRAPSIIEENQVTIIPSRSDYNLWKFQSFI